MGVDSFDPERFAAGWAAYQAVRKHMRTFYEGWAPHGPYPHHVASPIVQRVHDWNTELLRVVPPDVSHGSLAAARRAALAQTGPPPWHPDPRDLFEWAMLWRASSGAEQREIQAIFGSQRRGEMLFGTAAIGFRILGLIAYLAAGLIAAATLLTLHHPQALPTGPIAAGVTALLGYVSLDVSKRLFNAIGPDPLDPDSVRRWFGDELTRTEAENIEFLARWGAEKQSSPDLSAESRGSGGQPESKIWHR